MNTSSSLLCAPVSEHFIFYIQQEAQFNNCNNVAAIEKNKLFSRPDGIGSGGIFCTFYLSLSILKSISSEVANYWVRSARLYRNIGWASFTRGDIRCSAKQCRLPGKIIIFPFFRHNSIVLSKIMCFTASLVMRRREPPRHSFALKQGATAAHCNSLESGRPCLTNCCLRPHSARSRLCILL